MRRASSQPTLRHLRQTLAGIDPSNAPRLAGEERRIGLTTSIDAMLGGGLACGMLHELAPTVPLHLGAATGFGLALAARASGDRGQVIRHRMTSMPSAAATRWEIAPALSQPDAYGGIGRARFDLSLRKNRRGPSGRWIIEWDHHERAFQQAVSVGVAAAALDRPDRAPLVRAG